MKPLTPDHAIYAVHALAWSAFWVTRLACSRRDWEEHGSQPAVAAGGARGSRLSSPLIVLHTFAYGLLYYGLGDAVLGGRVPSRFPLQPVLGAVVILAGAALMCWALTAFRSWRIRARLEPGHRLATRGPFGLLRHPIYSGMNLIALGSALWVPTPILLAALALTLVGSDLRARIEERLLLEAFGEHYRDYMRRTRRFIPGLY